MVRVWVEVNGRDEAGFRVEVWAESICRAVSMVSHRYPSNVAEVQWRNRGNPPLTLGANFTSPFV
jgi:hypothetical protein